MFLLFISVCIIYFYEFPYWNNENYGRIGLIVFYYPCVIFLAIKCNLLKKVLENRIFLFLGTLSMTIFFWHVPLQLMLRDIDLFFSLHINYGLPIIFMLYVLGVVFFCAIYHKYIESKKINYKICISLMMMAFVGGYGVIYAANIYVSHVLNSSLKFSDKSECVELKNSIILSENIRLNKDCKLRTMRFYTMTWNKKYDKNQYLEIIIRNNDTEKVFLNKKISANQLHDGDIFSFNENIALNKGNYTIIFSTNPKILGNSIGILTTTKGKNDVGNALINERKTNAHIATDIIVKYSIKGDWTEPINMINIPSIKMNSKV